MRHPSALVAPALLLVACAGSPSPRPEDMSAADHRAEASRERDAARRALDAHGAWTRSFDEQVPGSYAGLHSAEERGPTGPVLGPRGATPGLYVAEAHARHAREHELAAVELEQFEDAECAGVEPKVRAACPLLTGADAVVDVPAGVEIRFADGVDVEGLYQRMRCHFAFARARGFSPDTTCALYVKGLRLEQPAPRVVRLLAGDAEAQARVRRATHEEVPVPRPAPPAVTR